jgi:Methyltransferase domain
MPSSPDVYTQDFYFASRLPDDPARERLWPVLCEYLQPCLPENGAVLELGGGYCRFINNIRAAEKHVVDLYPGVTEHAAQGVVAHVQSCGDLSNFKESSFDLVFASNLFEHLAKEELAATLAGVRRALRDGGKLLIIIQPNFRHCYRNYFDDYTRIQIFTETSLADLLSVNGFHPEKVFARILPLSLGPWLLRVYLALALETAGGTDVHSRVESK